MKGSPAYLRAPALACRMRADFVGGGHHGLNLFQIVDVESRNAVAIGCRMIQQLAHRDECHEISPGKLVTVR
jgi:hypothetical protein